MFSIQSCVVDIVNGGGDGACRHDVSGEDRGLGGREVEGSDGGGGQGEVAKLMLRGCEEELRED